MIVGSPTILNLVPGGVMKCVHVNQVNKNIEIQFKVMNGAAPYNVPEGVTCTIRGTKGDAFGYAAETAVTAGSNVITVTLTEQLTAVAGAGNIFELIFVGAADDMKVSTENFILAVERQAMGEDTVISDSDLSYAEQVLDQLQSVGAVNAQVQQNKANLAAEAAARQAADNTLQSNINSEASTRATTDASLQSQINQLVAPLGSAPSATEVENARVGADGTVYPTLGDAIRTQVTDVKSALDFVVKNNVTQIVAQENLVINQGNPTITITGDGFSSVLSASENCIYGFPFDTEIGKSYNVNVSVTSGPVYAVSAVRGTSYSSSIYLDRIGNVSAGTTVTLSFTATENKTTIWIYQRYNVNTISISSIAINNGMEYNNLDATLTSETKPAQAKAVGDRLPSMEWLGYENIFQVTNSDLVTDVVISGGAISRTIDGDTIIFAVGSTNTRTSYILRGMTASELYVMEFDSTADLTLSNQTAKITIGATQTSIGTTYANFTKTGNHYACTFKALDYPQYFVIPLKGNAGTVVLSNIKIKKASVSEPKNAYCDYSGTAITTFNKCLCIGDSLTYGGFNADNVDPDVGIEVLAEKYSYPTYLGKLTGIDIVKKAVGGLTSVAWWNLYGSDDLSGFDMAIIQLGVNDASPSKLNGWTQASIDAFTNIINKLKNENTGIKIFVATTVPAPAFQSTKINEVNAGIKALVQSMNDPNVIVADINTYGHTADSIGYDAGHLTAYGYNRLARDYVSLISYLMDTDMENFRFIQFIGTKYTYTDPA